MPIGRVFECEPFAPAGAFGDEPEAVMEPSLVAAARNTTAVDQEVERPGDRDGQQDGNRNQE